MPDIQSQQSGSTDQRGADNPNLQSPTENLQAAGVSEAQKKLLLEVRRRLTDKNSYIRRSHVRRVSRNFEYFKGNQYIVWDPYQNRFLCPFDDTSNGTNQNTDDFYHYVNNVIEWAENVFTSSLSSGVPKPIFMPVDADNENDQSASDQASKVVKKISRENKSEGLLRQAYQYLFLSGNYFRHTRYLRDADRAGVSSEPTYAMQEKEVKPERFTCSQCGAETPAQDVLQSPVCKQCGKPLDDSEYYEAVSMPMPVQIGVEEIPNGQVAWSLYNTLHIDVDPTVTDESVDPVSQTAYLDLKNEVELAALRAAYPGAWDEVKSSETAGTGSADSDYAKVARRRLISPLGYQQNAETSPTLSRCWLREWAFNVLDKKEDADSLRKLFPDGCKIVSVGDKVLEVVPEKLTDKWTWCGAKKGLGAYPPAVVDAGIPFQDRINDNGNNIHQFCDRMASPDAWYNTDYINGEALNGAAQGGGGLKPFKLKKQMAPGGKVSDLFFQPEFHISDKVFPYAQDLLQMFQLILGITPQTYGGHQEGIDTMGGQEQALNVASTILEIYFKHVAEEHASAAKIAVKCFVQNAVDDEKNTVDDDTTGESKFVNDVIRLDQLQGDFNCYPDTDQGIPQSAADIRRVMQEMLSAGAKNPVILEAFQPMQNRKALMKIIGPPGMEVPGQGAWNLVMQDINQLMQGQPLPPVTNVITGQTVELPSVLPAKELLQGFWDIALQACQVWGQKNYQKVSKAQPAQWQNFLAYLALIAQYDQESKAPIMPPVPPTNSATAPQPQGGQ